MFVYPSHLFFVMADSMVYYQVRPEGADRMKLRITLCLSPGAMGRPDFEQSVKAAREGIVQFNNPGHVGVPGGAAGTFLTVRSTGAALLPGEGHLAAEPIRP